MEQDQQQQQGQQPEGQQQQQQQGQQQPAANGPAPPQEQGQPQQQQQQPQQGAQEQKQEQPPPPNPQLDKYNEQWTSVNNNPTDFSAWTGLISAAEKLNDIERLRAVYEPFLAAYPLCYGYWKKYADAEQRHGNVEGALSVYDRGVTATPHSMDLWGHYAAYRRANAAGSPDDVRNVYECGLAACSSDYLAHSLWDKYIHYEEEQGSAAAVAALYSRALQCPLRELPRYMQSLKSFVQGRSASEIMPQEEMESLMSTVQAQKEQQAAAAREKAPEGEAPPAIDTSVSDEDIRAAWLAKREEFMNAAKAVADDRKPFEESIKRTYFHVKPLDASQLANWVRYLDHMEAKQDASPSDVTTVYERCLVPCASYPEFWERYVRWLERKGMEAEARNALQREVEVFCKTRPEAHLFGARFEERHGRVEEARSMFAHLTGHLAPRLLQVVVAAANFERRQGQIEAACMHYESLLNAERAKEGEGGSRLYPFMAMQYANFLKQMCGKAERGREVLRTALDSSPQIRQLWEAAILFEETCGLEGIVDRVLPLYEQAASEQPSDSGKKGLSEKDREELSLRSIDFADMYADANTLQQVAARHAARFQLPTSIAASASAAAGAAEAASNRKRAAETAADAVAKAPKADAASTPSAAAAAAPPPPPMPAAPPLPMPVASAAPPAYPAAPAYPGYGYPPGYPPAYPPVSGAMPTGYPGYGYPGYGYPGYGY